MQARSPSDSGPEPVSGMVTNNDNNILTSDKSCGTVELSVSTTVGVVSKKADWNANEFSNTPPADGFL